MVALTDVSVCIPTVGRPDELARTLETLSEGTRQPGAIFIGSDIRDDSVLARTREFAQSWNAEVIVNDRARGVCGNRNSLALQVHTPYLMFLDDDIDTPHTLLESAHSALSQGADVALSAATHMGGSGSLTRRGHFRTYRSGDNIAIGLQASAWRTALFCEFLLDENIAYGYEDAELGLRLYSRYPAARVVQLREPCIDRGKGRVDPSGERAHLVEQARGYVAAKRYSGRPISLGLFLLDEIAHNVASGRRPLPKPIVPGQWRKALFSDSVGIAAGAAR